MLGLLTKLVEDRPKVAALIADTDFDPAEIEKLPDEAFGWPEKRAFPLISREHTAASRVYRENLPMVPAEVDKRLKEACEVYNLPNDLFAREKRAAAPEDPEDYLLPDIRRLKVTSAEQVKVAEQRLLEGFSRLSIEHRAMACSRLVDKAAQYGATLNPLMHKLAGFTVSSTKVLKDWIEARVEASKEAEHKAAFQKLAGAVKRMPAESRDRASLAKLAEVIAELDKKAGLDKFWGKKLLDPLLTVFNTDKIAGAGVDLNGRFVPITRLASFPATFYGDILGDDIVREAADGRGGVDAHKLAAILETLPRDMKNLLASQIR